MAKKEKKLPGGDGTCPPQNSALGEETYHPMNKSANIRRLRQHCRMTQKEFIDWCLLDEEGVPCMSVSSLSNLESKGGAQINLVVARASEKLSVDAAVFSLPPEVFSQRLESFADPDSGGEAQAAKGDRKSDIAYLVNRLTLYFADEIFRGTLRKGSQVESDRELAKKLGVGRSAVREALKILFVMGIVDIRPGQGTYISEKDTSFFVVPLSWSLFLNSTQIDSILVVRDLLEEKAAELSASRGREEKLAKLGDIFYKLKVAYEQEDVQRFLDYDVEFHVCIAECSENPVIYSEIQTIRNLLRRVSQTGMADLEQVREIYHEHLKVYGAIISGEPDRAREAMREHMRKSSDRYRFY